MTEGHGQKCIHRISGLKCITVVIVSIQTDRHVDPVHMLQNGGI